MKLTELINHPERLNPETLYELRNIVARYPYFHTARILLLSNLYLLHDTDFGNELRKAALYVRDRRVLFRLIEGDKYFTDDMAVATQEQEPDVDRTLCLIDSFLENHTFSDTTSDDTQGTAASTIPLYSAPIGNYAETFLATTEENDDKSQAPDNSNETDKEQKNTIDLINDFLERPKEHISPLPQEETPQADAGEENTNPLGEEGEENLEEHYFTETLAKIYIKQRKYSRALEIIRSLYLKYPEKNAYFADQIRFLEKLIINNNSK